MKTFVRFTLYGLTILALVVSATGATANPEQNVLQSGKIFTVYPSGDDDTANLQQAFDLALAAGPGSTVKLAPGNFRIGLIEVWDFKGYFKGAGQGVSIIDSLENMDCQPLLDNNQYPALIYFVRGYPRISDLSFHITPYAPCLPYNMAVHGPDWLGTNIFPLVVAASPWNMDTDCSEIQIEQVSASIERVTIEGAEGARLNGETDPIFPNIYEGLYLGGTNTLDNIWGSGCYQAKYAQGQFRVVQSTFRHALVGLMVTFLYNSPALIGGSPKNGNTFDDNIWGSVHNESSGSNFEFSHNRMNHIYGNAVFLWQGYSSEIPFLQAASNYVYRNNDLTVEGYGNGFLLFDNDNMGTPDYPSTGSRANVVVKNNRLNLLPDMVWGIWIEGLSDPLIFNNKIKGNSDMAIAAGAWGATRGGLIKGNNLKEFTSYYGYPFKIRLDWGTENYVVVGASVEEVLDLGTNNVIIGKDGHSPDKSGQEIQEAMEQKMEIIKNLPRRLNMPVH